MAEELLVRSDVARDILGTASDYGSVPKMVVEYVSNSLDNPDDPDQPVTVYVNISRPYGGKREVMIADNGSGMDHDGLSRFFVMHGENVQRQRGRRARGKFGTGKSAGFGVGTAMRVETIRNGEERKVELTHAELIAASREQRLPRPQQLSGYGKVTDRRNGTTVVVSGVRKRADADAIANALRNRLGRQVERHRVYVDGERVHLHEPTPTRTWDFPLSADGAAHRALAAYETDELHCIVKTVSPGATVDEAIRGVIVTSRDVPVGQYLAGGDHTNRIWGLCEVPSLDTDTSTPSPFTDRRDMTLNTDNALAAAVVTWVRRCLERAARMLADEERDRRRRARDAELSRAAERAEKILNEHYRTDFRLASGAGAAGGSSTAPGSRAGETSPGPEGNIVLPDQRGTAGYQPARRAGPPGAPVTPDSDLNDTNTSRNDPGEARPAGSPQPQDRDPLGDGRGKTASQIERRRHRPRRGGFQIDYAPEGADAPRAHFVESDLTIVINTDHPLLAAISPGNDLFQGLAFTIAAEEYAQYTTNRLITEGHIDIEDPYEALQRMRTTMDQLTRAFAQVFDTLTRAGDAA